jgi:glucose-1-phosphate adenylyltransferase
VENSILGPGVCVEKGATVRDAVLIGNTVVASGATVCRAIVDHDATIGEGAQVGNPEGGEIIVIPAEMKVDAGSVLLEL